MPTSLVRRRAFLAGSASTIVLPSLAQPGRAAPRRIIVAQVCDVSAQAQDVTRDFLVGARAAWQDVNARGGLHGRAVEHLSLEVDGSRASLQRAWDALRDNPACVVLSGTAGDPAATGHR